MIVEVILLMQQQADDDVVARVSVAGAPIEIHHRRGVETDDRLHDFATRLSQHGRPLRFVERAHLQADGAGLDAAHEPIEALPQVKDRVVCPYPFPVREDAFPHEAVLFRRDHIVDWRGGSRTGRCGCRRARFGGAMNRRGHRAEESRLDAPEDDAGKNREQQGVDRNLPAANRTSLLLVLGRSLAVFFLSHGRPPCIFGFQTIYTICLIFSSPKTKPADLAGIVFGRRFLLRAQFRARLVEEGDG